MSERSGIYNKSGQYMDIDLATWNSLLKHDIGVVLGIGDELKVDTGTGLEVKVGTGGCWLGEPCGWWYYNDAQKSLILDAEVEGYKRADRIVVRHDRNADALESVVVVKKGVPATVDPQPPGLQQDGMVFELPLAQVTVTGGTNEIELVDDRVLGGDVYKVESFTLDITHRNCFIRCNSTSDITITVPLDIFSKNTDITIWQMGTGQVTIANGDGVQIFPADERKIDGQYKAVTLRQYDPNCWALIGALTS